MRSYLTSMRDTFTDTLDTMSEKSPNRFGFFVQFYLIFALITLVLSLLIIWIFFQVKYPGVDFVDIIDSNESGIWLQYLSQIDLLMVIFLIRYYYSTDVMRNQRYSIGGLFKSLNAKTWSYYLLCVFFFAFIYALFFFMDLQLGFVYGNNLENLMDIFGDDPFNYFDIWLSSLKHYAVALIPFLLIALFSMQQRDRNNFKYGSLVKESKRVFIFIVIASILSYLYLRAIQLSGDLLINGIAIPFTENYIPLIFSVIVMFVANSVFFMLFSYVAVYSFNKREQVVEESRQELDNIEILDQ